MAIDAVMLDLPDTDANVAAFPKPEGQRPFPQCRIVGLAELGTRAVTAVEIGTIHTGERELALPLTRWVTSDMLFIADRGFYSFPLWQAYLDAGAQLLIRVLSTHQLPVLRRFPDGSDLSEVTNQHRGSKTRIDAAKIDDITLATHIPVRVVEYQITGHANSGAPSETFRIITSLTDPDQASAQS